MQTRPIRAQQRRRPDSNFRMPSAPMLLLAALFLTAALALAAQDRDMAAAVATLAAAATVGAELCRIGLWDNRTSPSMIARLFAQAQAGKRLAIYDRETGLFAHWYLTLRGEEECARASRYDRSLSLLVIEPGAGDPSAAWALKAEIGRWIQTELRATDIAGYVGNGRFVILAPEAGRPATATLVERISSAIPGVDIGMSAFPDDGDSYSVLWRHATLRLRDSKLADAA